MLKLLLGTDRQANHQYILRMLAEDVSMGKNGRIYMVPELISHQTERELAKVAGDTASRYAEVLSFSRLAKRVAENTMQKLPECLDNGGRVVAMAAALKQLHSKLKAYAAVETRPEFIISLLDAIDEFKRCCILPSDLFEAAQHTEGSLAQKLEELALIYEAYNSLCVRGKRDPRDQMTWLLEQLEDCNFAKDHVFYVEGFPDFSRLHMDILQYLICQTDVVLSLQCDTPGSDRLAFEKAAQTAADLLAYVKREQIPYQLETIPARSSKTSIVTDVLFQGNIQSGAAKDLLRVIKTDCAADACNLIAEQVISLVQQGCRYRDISIVCTDLDSFRYSIQSVFQRAHIPAYLSGTEDILDKTVIHTVLCALEAALGNFAQKDVIRYLKSMLSPIPVEVCDQMENYAIMWSLNGKAWLNDWDMHPRGLGEQWTERDHRQLEILNKFRQKALSPLQQLREQFSGSISVPQQVMALYRFLSDVKLAQRLEILAQNMEDKGDHRNAQILNQLWDILIGALEQLHDTLADTSWDVDTFPRLLKLLLSQYDVGTIPSVLDAVMIGSISAMRCQNEKHLIILGASEGLFPSYGTSSGVFNDQERAILKQLGVGINPGTIDGLQTQFSEIQEVFLGASDSITVFCTDGQPSYIYKRLEQLAGEEESAKPVNAAALSDRWEAAAVISAQRNREAAQHLGLCEEYDKIRACEEHALGQVTQEHVRRLYGEKLRLSASQIDKMADCRLHYFLRYGLSAKERTVVSVDPTEFGTYVHAVLELCGNQLLSMGGFRAVSLEETLQIAQKISEEYFTERFSAISNERLSYSFRKNSQELQAIVKELWEEMQECEFQPFQFELEFGETDGMPAVHIPGSIMDAELRGKVDRVDSWEHEGKTYIRVVDYKTGKKDFDYCDVFNGLGLQMLLYMYALEDGGATVFGDDPAVSGVQYFPARVPLAKADGSLTEEQAAAEHRKTFKRNGLILSDEAVLRAMEPSDTPKRLSITRKKDGTVSGDIASAKQFALLKKYMFKLLRHIVDDIGSGNVTPNPYTRGSYHNACRFCPYGTVCHVAEVEGRRNYQQMSADRFWEEIEKEACNHG